MRLLNSLVITNLGYRINNKNLEQIPRAIFLIAQKQPISPEEAPSPPSLLPQKPRSDEYIFRNHL